MYDENTIPLIFKFGPYKWMDKLFNGNLSFSCAGNFINQAQLTGNMEQGDLDEAIFARLNKGSSKIREMEILLGSDLQIIDDGDYVKLRRRSCCFIPVFCMYSMKTENFMSQITHTGRNEIIHLFDDRIYDSFAANLRAKSLLVKDELLSIVVIQPKPFLSNFNYITKKQGIKSQIGFVNYMHKQDDEFLIEPTNEREELYNKYSAYSYQQELRIILPELKLANIYDRYNIHFHMVNPQDIQIFFGDKVKMKANAYTRRGI